MFPDGSTDVVVWIDANGLPVDLAAAWKNYIEVSNPPGFVIVAVDGIPFGEGATDHEYEPRMRSPDGDEKVLWHQVATVAEARAFLWRCHEKPHHVSFWARFGEQLDLSMSTILEWTDAQLSESWDFLQARAEWESKRPAQPDFWPHPEE